MKTIEENFTKFLNDILYYDNNNAIEKIIMVVFETILNLERNEFLKEDTSGKNKGNGYYERLVRSVNDYLRIKVPRDCLSLFKPVFLDTI